MNITHDDDFVRDRVLYNLLKMYYEAAGRGDADILRHPEESFEEAIGRVVLALTDGAYWPLKQELDDLVETALARRRRWGK